jgi:hypothetical protein
MAPKYDSLMLLGFWLLVVLPTAHACVEGRSLAAAGKWDYNRCNAATKPVRALERPRYMHAPASSELCVFAFASANPICACPCPLLSLFSRVRYSCTPVLPYSRTPLLPCSPFSSPQAAWGDAVTGSFCGAANVQQSPVNVRPLLQLRLIKSQSHPPICTPNTSDAILASQLYSPHPPTRTFRPFVQRCVLLRAPTMQCPCLHSPPLPPLSALRRSP